MASAIAASSRGGTRMPVTPSTTTSGMPPVAVATMGLAAAIASARLNGSTLDVGQSYELYVIAAAVVGGTSFAGGIGTIPGAVLGAFVLQSLAYGLSFVGVNSPGQNIVAGIVLILAVGFDTYNRRRSST